MFPCQQSSAKIPGSSKSCSVAYPTPAQASIPKLSCTRTRPRTQKGYSQQSESTSVPRTTPALARHWLALSRIHRHCITLIKPYLTSIAQADSHLKQNRNFRNRTATSSARISCTGWSCDEHSSMASAHRSRFLQSKRTPSTRSTKQMTSASGFPPLAPSASFKVGERTQSLG